MDLQPSLFVCPVCGALLSQKDNSYICPKRHCYDIACDGHINLLLANQKHSLSPGDDKDMVKSRRQFLQKDYYLPLRQALEDICIKYSPQSPFVLDVGCGEGYYTKGICNALQQSCAQIYGIDISKYAVQYAAKYVKNASFAVASAFSLPFAKNSFHLLVNCFSPLCIAEFARVLKPHGYFIYVVPAPRHLWQLKCAVYQHPYENEQIDTNYNGFKHIAVVNSKSNISLNSSEDINSLFGMTPYVWKTSKEDKARLATINSLNIEIEFNIHIYQKA